MSYIVHMYAREHDRESDRVGNALVNLLHRNRMSWHEQQLFAERRLVPQ